MVRNSIVNIVDILRFYSLVIILFIVLMAWLLGFLRARISVSCPVCLSLGKQLP